MLWNQTDLSVALSFVLVMRLWISSLISVSFSLVILEMGIIKYISLGFCKDHKDIMQGKCFTLIWYMFGF